MERRELKPLKKSVIADIQYSDCHLAIRAEESKLSLALQDARNFHIRDYRTFSWPTIGGISTLENYLEEFKNFSSAKTIVCSIDNFASTLIPEAIYQENNRSTYLGFNFELEDKQTVASDHLALLDAINVYQQPAYCETIARYFPKCRFVHESGVQIELALRLSRLNQEDAAFLFFSNQFFRLCIIQNGTLQFSNTFQYHSEMDVAYYVLYVFDQLHLKSASIATYATGNVTGNDAVVNMLQDYIGPIQLLRTCSLAQLQLNEEDLTDAQFNFTLFHQALCV